MLGPCVNLSEEAERKLEKYFENLSLWTTMSERDSLRPVTVKQLFKAEPMGEAEFKVDGVQLDLCTLVGQVRKVCWLATNVSYEIDDGSGVIAVKRWIDPEKEDVVDKTKIVEGEYVRVLGRLKLFGEERHVGAHVIRVVLDSDEINYHFLEAEAVSLFFTRGPPVSAVIGENIGVSVVARRIYECLATAVEVDRGLNDQEIALRLGMDMAEVVAGTDELLSHSLIRSTLNEYTWAILSGRGGVA